MKIEIEVSDEQIKEGLADVVHKQVMAYLGRYFIEDEIRKMVSAAWPAIAQKMVDDAIAKRADFEAKIQAELEKKIRARLERAMRLSDK